jgi:hypothetical protein
MLEGTGLGMNIVLSALPFLNEALGFAAMGMVPGGAHKKPRFSFLPIIGIGWSWRRIQKMLNWISWFITWEDNPIPKVNSRSMIGKTSLM